ncbi:APC family permease [Mycobacterium sp. AZCC_0083]|uniref:APC family permease n=1 Tax=Mycobacterium sp. AZCC_0083 TaxID=2735882 RepID=UPI0017FE2573|nr:APC family permease [Mycobacterium sp. AZCC_0083]MBB5161659.1 amino acid transporter [Mycobacterium sp. AZCC_0083]
MPQPDHFDPKDFTMATSTTPAGAPAASAKPVGLRVGVLGFPTLLAQSIALISPTMTAVLIVPLAFSDAGNGTWLAYLFATVMLSFVVMNLNQFARRSASPGSMYAYIGRGLGPRWGVLSGWTLLWSYAFIAIAGFTGFSIFVDQFLDAIGMHHHPPAVVCFAISAAICWFIACKDIRVSSLLTLVLEGLSMAVILGICMVVLFRGGSPVDTAQLSLHGVDAKSTSLAVVICIFSLVGFESATALGGEAKKPLVNVPRAVAWSLAITGLFFVFVSYVEVLGSAHAGLSLSDLAAPVNALADAYHVSYLQAPISLGAMVSFFSLSLSCINAGARILYPMALHGAFPRAVGNSHDRNRTPHVAITVYTVVVVAIPAVMQLFTDPLTTFGDAGTLAAFGFLLAYYLISIAALVYLRRRGEMTRKTIAVTITALLCLLVPTIGSFYPLPPVPVRYFPYYFLAYMLVGVAWLAVLHRRDRNVLTAIEADLEATVDARDHPIADSTVKS